MVQFKTKRQKRLEDFFIPHHAVGKEVFVSNTITNLDETVVCVMNVSNSLKLKKYKI